MWFVSGEWWCKAHGWPPVGLAFTTHYSLRGGEPRSDGVPVHDLPPGVNVIGALVLVAQVVGVLPHIDAEKRRLTGHVRAVLVGAALNRQLAAADDQPRPA